MRDYTLGLDIGSKSIGWALLETKPEPSIVDIGVRVFPEGVDRDTKGAELSKNAKRREARGARRINERRRRRREKLVKVLQGINMLPTDEKKFTAVMAMDPYVLRAKGLDEKIEPCELGRALYHINQRRGFKSNRKAQAGGEEGIVKKQAGQLQSDIESHGCRTLGEYLASLDPHKQRRRERYTFRSMYLDEFNKLWQKQSEYYSEILTDGLKSKIGEETIFYQRPLKLSDELIGYCELEPEERRCPRADWFARRFRLLQDVNNLKIQNSDGSSENLTSDQRADLLIELGKKKEMAFGAIRKKFGLLESQKFNLEQDGKIKKLKGDVFNSTMSRIIGAKKWDAIGEEEKILLNTMLVEMEDDELVEALGNEWGLDAEQIEKVFKLQLPSGYMSFSRKAIRKLLVLMQQGVLTHEAEEKVYSDNKKKSDVVAEDRLRLPEDLRNPIVNKALHEVRKVVNSIIAEYGKSKRIVVEMARDVKGGLDERREIHFKMLDNQKRNEEVRTKLVTEFDIRKPTRDDVIKYKLWDECGGVCPYTGKAIASHMLFCENPEFQIEHILPYKRSLDDSYMNKTLCEVGENVRKDDQIPFEYYGGTEQYEQIQQRITILPWPKRQKFLQKNIELDTCIERELNDTRYITKEVIRYLKQLGVIVKGTRGKVTAELRDGWGLNNILDQTEMGLKNRDDHRHHAIDAAVVAVTKNEHLRKLAKTKYASMDRSFPEPWDEFRSELENKINKIYVSHRASRRVRGKLHEETSYGPTDTERVYVYRKKLDALTLPMVAKIADPVVKEIVRKRLKKFEINPDGRGKIGKEVWADPLYMKSNKGAKVLIKKVRIRDVFNNMIGIKDTNSKVYRYVTPGNNHHIEIFEYTDDRGKLKREGKVISMFEAVKRSQSGRPIICQDYGNGMKFVCSLAKNEMFMLEVEPGEYVLHRVQKLIQDGRIVFRPHTFAGKVSDSDNPPLIQRKSYNTLKGYKVTVDPLGRIYPAND